MNYQQHADNYIKLIAKNYTQSRINADVRGFVRGFAKYLQTATITEQIRNASGDGIALITENINHTTGGRYYTWQIAYALAEAGFKVTIYTDGEPTFASYFDSFRCKPTVEIIGSTSTDLSNANIRAEAYVGSPIHGSLCAIRNGKRYNKPYFPMIFDPLPMIADYRDKHRFPEWDTLTAEIRDSDCKIITLAKSIHPYIHQWLDKTEKDLFHVYPCVNTLARDQAKKPPREEFVLFISRLVPNKRFDLVLGACKDNQVNLKVVFSASGIDHNRLVQTYSMEARTEFIQNPSDVEKFELIHKARAVINGANYEGFGMWLAEAISCGTPAVCFQYPTFTEIRNEALVDNVYMAKWNDQKSLSKALALALAEKKYRHQSDAFAFSTMVERMGYLFT